MKACRDCKRYEGFKMCSALPERFADYEIGEYAINPREHLCLARGS